VDLMLEISLEVGLLTQDFQAAVIEVAEGAVNIVPPKSASMNAFAQKKCV
jgi:hypothetical protein